MPILKFAATVAAMLGTLHGRQQTPPLTDVLTRVSSNVRELEASLPDYICKETLLRREILRGTLIDTGSMRVMRLEMLQDVPNFQPRPSVADYGSVDIAGKEFWLLTSYTMTAYGGTVNQDMAYEWIARYSNCRKFEVTVEITPVR